MKGNKQAQEINSSKKLTTQLRRRYGFVIGLILIVVALSFGTFQEEESSPPLSDEEIAALPAAPVIGARAPDFDLEDITGQPVSLNHFQGKPIVMMFFHSWWPVCNQNAPALRAAEEKYGEDLVVLFVDEQEGSGVVETFAERHNLTSVIVMDMTGEIGKKYQLISTPTTFFIDSHGVIQEIKAGVIRLDWIDHQMAVVSK